MIEKEQKSVRIRVNNKWCVYEIGRDLDSNETLSHLLRERLGLTGVKLACDQGACGACTVMLNGKAILSCMMLAIEANGCEILTIEGLEMDDPIVNSFANQCEPGYGTALQCGFCTPGFVMTTRALLNKNIHPTKEEIENELSGNICRCGCYPAITKAVQNAASKIRDKQ